MVTRAQKEKSEGDAASDEGSDGSHEWEALKLLLSKDDVIKGTEIESYIIKDLLVRHRQHFHS